MTYGEMRETARELVNFINEFRMNREWYITQRTAEVIVLRWFNEGGVGKVITQMAQAERAANEAAALNAA
jgi:hypothetical protein